MEAWMMTRVTLVSDSMSFQAQQACWCLVVVMVSFLGEYSLPILLLLVYIFHRPKFHEPITLDIPQSNLIANVQGV